MRSSRLALLGAVLGSLGAIGQRVLLIDEGVSTQLTDRVRTRREPAAATPRSRPSYLGQTPEQARSAIHAAQIKRDRRIERNIRNEAAQGREPEGLTLVGGMWTADCKSCGKEFEVGCDAADFNADMSYCGGQWCQP